MRPRVSTALVALACAAIAFGGCSDGEDSDDGAADARGADAAEAAQLGIELEVVDEAPVGGRRRRSPTRWRRRLQSAAAS